MRLLDKLINKIAHRLLALIINEPALQQRLTGHTGPMGLMGKPGPGVSDLFEQWKYETNQPDATIEQFLIWFNKTLKQTKTG